MLKKYTFIFLLISLSPWLSRQIHSAWTAQTLQGINHSQASTTSCLIDRYPLEIQSSKANFNPLQNLSLQDHRFDLIMEMVVRYNPRLSVWTRHQIVDQIIEASETYSLDPFLITAVIAAESSFRPQVVSPCGAQGLMQLTPMIQPELGVDNAFNIEENIQGGCRFLSKLSKRFNDTILTLAAYNAGPTRVARLGRVPRILETQNYGKKVRRLTSELTSNFLSRIPFNSLRAPLYGLSTAPKALTALTCLNEPNSFPVVLKHTHKLKLSFGVFLLAASEEKGFNTLIATDLVHPSLLSKKLIMHMT